MLERHAGGCYAILFTAEGEPTDETHETLRRLCRSYLILPGHARSRFAKSARALGRFLNAGLHAPAWIEERGRGPVQQEISAFLDRHRPEALVLSKLETVHLVGEAVLRGFNGARLLDLHDDFVAREGLSRQSLTELLAVHPALAGYPPYRMMRLRQRLSRFDPELARRQERATLGLFDRILISSREEYERYALHPGLVQACVHAPWPVGGGRATALPLAPGAFDAGFIASDAPFNLEAMLYLTQEILPRIRKVRPDFRVPSRVV
jgi:hypothetical protein